MITQVQVGPQAVEILKKLILAPNEGVMFVKFVLLKQDSLSKGEAMAKAEAAPAALLLGDLDEMKAQLSAWLDEAVAQYKKGVINGNSTTGQAPK